MLYTSLTFVPFNYDMGEADIVFVGIPFCASVSKPAIYGPTIVRESLKLKDDSVTGKRIFDKLKLCDLGDIEIVPGSYKLSAERIHDTIKSIRESNPGAFILVIGGDHTITLPVCEELKPKTITQLDAHADLRKDYLGNKYMQQTWAFHASQFTKLVQYGCEYTQEDHKEKAVKLEDVKIENLPKPIHLTLDIDIFKDAETGLPEGKLTEKEVFPVIDEVAPHISSMDIVELAADKLPSRTGFLAAECIKRVLAAKLYII
jgi:agmatinase